MTPLERFLEKLEVVRASGTGWSARCPAHDDRSPSLSVHEGEDGRVLAKCHRGCETAAVCAAVGLSLRDLMPVTDGPTATFKANGRGDRAARVYPTAEAALGALKDTFGATCRTWTYHDGRGQPVQLVARWDTKNGKVVRPVGRVADGWRVGALDGRRPLLGLRELSVPGPALVLEGEPCVDVARALGLTATTSSGGAQAAKRSDWSVLAGREVWVLPDHDEPGRKYAADVAQLLGRLKPRPVVKVLDPAAVFGRTDLPPGFDLADAVAGCPDAAARAALRAALERVARSAPGAGGTRAALAPDLICFADVVPAEVRWLWYGRLPLARLSLLAGRPGLGKSFLTCDAAARVSTGADWPDGTPAPLGDVLLICAEDDPADTIAPRLIGAGADRARVHLLRAARVEQADGCEATVAFDLSNVQLVRDALARLPDCKLVVIDPIGSYLGGEVDGHRDNAVRAVLAPLALLASEAGVAVLMVAHNRKSESDFADDTVLGSRAFTGLARSVLHLLPDPEDRGRKLLLPGKCNLSVSAPGLAYRIAGDPPRLEWEPDPLDLHADDLMTKGGRRGKGEGERPPRATKLTAAVEWLAELLADGALSVEEVRAQADAAGLSWGTMRRAQQTLNIKPRKEAFSGGWVWALPGEGAHAAGGGPRRPTDGGDEHLRDSSDESAEEPPGNCEDAHSADDLGAFATPPEDAHHTQPAEGRLFDNPETPTLPD